MQIVRVFIVALALLLLLAPVPTLAHGGEEDGDAVDPVTQVRQAITALSLPQPNVELAGGAIHELLELDEAEGVNLVQIEAADEALDSGDTAGALVALQAALTSAAPAEGEPADDHSEDGQAEETAQPTEEADHDEAAEPAGGEQTLKGEAANTLLPYEAAFAGSGTEYGLLGAAVVLILLGGLIVARV